MGDGIRAQIDLDRCSGHGRCYMAAPEIFDCDDDGYPVVIGSAETADAIAALERAMSNCPEHAISTSN